MADALSRRASLFAILRNKIIGFEVLKDIYADDPDFADIWAKCQSGQPTNGFHIAKGYLFKGN